MVVVIFNIVSTCKIESCADSIPITYKRTDHSLNWFVAVFCAFSADSGVPLTLYRSEMFSHTFIASFMSRMCGGRLRQPWNKMTLFFHNHFCLALIKDSCDWLIKFIHRNASEKNLFKLWLRNVLFVTFNEHEEKNRYNVIRYLLSNLF